MNITVWDYAESGLNKANRLAEASGVQIRTELVDLHDVLWKQDQWDEIICVFGHFPKALRTRTLEGVKTAVKPGGYFLTEVYSPYQIPYRSGDRKISNFIRARGFPRTLCRLADCPLFMGEVVRHEGQGHQGLSHVIQFAGQKPLRT